MSKMSNLRNASILTLAAAFSAGCATVVDKTFSGGEHGEEKISSYLSKPKTHYDFATNLHYNKKNGGLPAKAKDSAGACSDSNNLRKIVRQLNVLETNQASRSGTHVSFKNATQKCMQKTANLMGKKFGCYYDGSDVRTRNSKDEDSFVADSVTDCSQDNAFKRWEEITKGEYLEGGKYAPQEEKSSSNDSKATGAAKSKTLDVIKSKIIPSAPGLN